MQARNTPQHFTGCLLGGAVGDALGAAVEFLSISDIRAKYGADGIRDYDVAYGRRGAITDDTQMTLFTAEGVLRAAARWEMKGICHAPTVIHHAYLRWLHTQGLESTAPIAQEGLDGWLITVKQLHSRRAPGMTCVAALRGDRMGTIEQPLNHSKGCGGVMRVAPVGLIANGAQMAFDLGCNTAAITHGHPSGYYSAGAFAAIINLLRDGHALTDAITTSLRLLADTNDPRHEECATALRNAVARWRQGEAPTPEVIETFGGAWVGEEALAIALYCALHAGGDFERGVLLAVNHSGDSDSTGAITGNLLGLMRGSDAIASTWLEALELREEIEAIARDLQTHFDSSDAWLERYPGW